MADRVRFPVGSVVCCFSYLVGPLGRYGVVISARGRRRARVEAKRRYVIAFFGGNGKHTADVLGKDLRRAVWTFLGPVMSGGV